MCNPALAVFAIGAGMSYKADRDAAKQREEELTMWYDKNLKQEREGQDEIDARVKEQLPNYEVDQVQQRIREQSEKTEGSINDAVLQGNLSAETPNSGKVSGAYQRATAQHTADNARDIAELATRYAGLQAPNLVNLRDSVQREDKGWDIQAAMDNIGRQGAIHDRAASLVNVTANPWLKGIGTMMMMYGGASAGAGAGGAGQGATVTTSAPTAYGSAAGAGSAAAAGGGSSLGGSALSGAGAYQASSAPAFRF